MGKLQSALPSEDNPRFWYNITRIKSIAEACGFCNVAYLSNVFRRETGLSPRAWRTRG